MIPTTDAGKARNALTMAWFGANPNQPMPEGRAQVEKHLRAIEAEARIQGQIESVAGSGPMLIDADRQLAALREALEANHYSALPHLTRERSDTCEICRVLSATAQSGKDYEARIRAETLETEHQRVAAVLERPEFACVDRRMARALLAEAE